MAIEEQDQCRFWSKVCFGAPGGCWLWTCWTRSGYGRIKIQGKSHSSHRLSWQLLKGPIAPGIVLDHLCGVKSCVNPEHLEEVTVQENSRRANTGRSVTTRRADKQKRICERESCDKFVHGRGLCRNHYTAAHKREKFVPLTPEQRFWSKTDKTENCWLWTDYLTARGYGRLKVDGKTVQAHIYSYLLHLGPVPLGMVLDHLCSVKNCVNPEHLQATTLEDNIRRAV